MSLDVSLVGFSSCLVSDEIRFEAPRLPTSGKPFGLSKNVTLIGWDVGENLQPILSLAMRAGVEIENAVETSPNKERIDGVSESKQRCPIGDRTAAEA